MLKLNVASFIDALEEAEGYESYESQECRFTSSAYLNSHVVMPLLRGSEVRLDELDFDAFDFEDTINLMEYGIELSKNPYKLRSFLLPILEASPMANRNVRFV